MTTRQISDLVYEKDPVSLRDTTSVYEACRKMRDRRVGAVLVTDNRQRLIGIFTGRDAVVKVLAHGRDPKATPLADVMTLNPVSLPPGKTAIDALRLMQ